MSPLLSHGHFNCSSFFRSAAFAFPSDSAGPFSVFLFFLCLCFPCHPCLSLRESEKSNVAKAGSSDQLNVFCSQPFRPLRLGVRHLFSFLKLFVGKSFEVLTREKTITGLEPPPHDSLPAEELRIEGGCAPYRNVLGRSGKTPMKEFHLPNSSSKWVAENRPPTWHLSGEGVSHYPPRGKKRQGPMT